MIRSIGIIIVFVFVLNSISMAQMTEGFEPEEAKMLIAVCNSYTFIEMFGSDSLIIHDDLKKVYTSEATELDNVFQVYEGNHIGIINFRGSTTKTSSWFENFYSAMIPAKGIIKINDNDCPYKFANDSNAAVHSGYALSVVIQSSLLIEQINSLNTKGIYDIYITGHSQGGALTHMVRAYLDNLPEGKISPENTFKAYSFANPMIGNEAFSIEYNERFSATQMSFCIHNPDDPAPKMPTHFERDRNLFGNLFYKCWADYLLYGKKPELKSRIVQIFEPPLKLYIYLSNKLIERFIAASYISIALPNYVHDINYYHVGEIHELEPFPAPEVQADLINMPKRKVAKLKIDRDGKYYEKKSVFFQHKPYNYYVAILKKYFPEEYEELEYEYLPDDLRANSCVIK